MKRLFMLPNHWQSAIKIALDRMGRNGNLPNVFRNEINTGWQRKDQLQVEMYADDDQVLQFGVYIGNALAAEEKAEKKSGVTKGYAYFAGYPSVGISAYSFDFEIPELDNEFREETRKQLAEMYKELYGEFGCQIIFEDEKQYLE